MPLLDAWRANRAAASTAIELAAAFLERARTLRQPMYFGRAEAVLAPLASKPGASVTLRRMYAQVLQHRHDFAAAETLLDSALRDAPHDDGSRLLRASVRLVRGDFPGARADCARLAAAGGDGATPGFTCLAEALAGSGGLERARALLAILPDDGDAMRPATPAYLLATRAELRERSHDNAGAIADYREALGLAPHDDAIRAALADVLVAWGRAAEARRLLAVDKPSLGLLVRSAALFEGARRTGLAARARAWLELEAARGDAIHYREAAMLALVNADSAAALAAARAARDVPVSSALRQWLHETGFRDSVTEDILDGRSRS